jgi:hypothetical protein
MRTFSIQLPLMPLTVGQVVDRSAWPPHITVIGNFRAGGSTAVEAAVARFAATTPPIRTAVEDEAWFGPDGTVLVDRVEVPLLRSLHSRLLDELEAHVDGLEMLLPDHTREGYWPHRTVTAGPRPVRGDVLEAGRVALAELDPPGRPGLADILGVWPLEGARQQD